MLADLAPVQREIRGRSGGWYDVRIRPYRTVDNKIDGVVITLIDVTEWHQVNQTLRESEQQLQQKQRLFDLSRDPIFVWDFDSGLVEWNRGSEELCTVLPATRRSANQKSSCLLLPFRALHSPN